MDALNDIKKKLEEGRFRNEEHVRLSLVARLLQEYGWDIWNPAEVNTEFKPTPEEDSKRVDVGLFGPTSKAVIFIEVKPVGGITNLGQVERQLHEYNRNFSAPFCIVTDGAQWRFYYALTAGNFGSKCFKRINLITDDPDDIQRFFAYFLDKNQVQSEDAERLAKHLLSLNEIEQILTSCSSEARRATLSPPYPTLPAALKALAEQRGVHVSLEDVQRFLEKVSDGSPPDDRSTGPSSDASEAQAVPPGRRIFPPENPPDLAHTRISTASIGGQNANNWNALVVAGLRLAWECGYRDAADIRRWSGANVRSGNYNREGFRPVRGTDLSFQFVQASRAWEVALRIAKKLRVPIAVDFDWREHPDAIYPLQQGRMEWRPEAGI